MITPSLLIVDDDEDIRTQMKWALASDYQVVLAGDRSEAVSQFTVTRPAVTLLDLGLPPRPNEPDEGLAALASLLAIDPFAKIIIISGQGEKQNALGAVGSGAYDFLTKPVDMDALKVMVQRSVYVSELEHEYRALQQSRRSEGFDDILGDSPQMQTVFALIRKVAPTTAPVLILGESGAGKEIVAQTLHRRSPHRNGPFVALNCNAIPEHLLESELFGHERGAFTGAHAQRKGHIESAAGGTLFLDEIGDMPPAVQVKLLRFLQEKRFQRVGGRQEFHSDARVIAATNVDLQQSVANGRFREDLYFRLAVVVLTVPPLRQRGDDIGQIARHFLQRYGTQHGKTKLTFSADAVRAIQLHRWPGNVRELQNRIQRGVIMAEGKRVTADDLELANTLADSAPQTLKEARESVEREVVQDALRRHRGKIAAAALELGISRPTLYELIDRLGIAKSVSSAE
jgi:two-component system NtrC family response regulator